MPDRLISAREAASLLAVGVSTFYDWLKSGRLDVRPMHLGKRAVRYRAADILAWAIARQQPVVPG